MLSVYPNGSLFPSAQPQRLKFDELGDSANAVQRFTKLAIRSGKTAIRLQCTVPTWGASDSTTYFDLHDLHDLRSRLLVFIHDLLHSLRASGISASYSLRLVPANSPLCTICVLPSAGSLQVINSDALSKVLAQDDALFKRKQVVLVDLEDPWLILT
ncbi:hypothetical protein BJ165DRAFT_1522101 [Panaeolus papilionaceus]|nr:hypothetical protein BJ165DRAFT_1522101 [Panaeolus papilionaceus]